MNYKQEHLDFLIKNKELTRAEITKQFNQRFATNQSVSAISSICKKHEFLTGRTGCFPKGNVPVNKGTKGLTGVNKTSFTKGHKPHNYVPVGSEAITTDGYLKVKIADPNLWAHKHKLIWEKVNGAIPEGLMLCFLDGNPLNCVLSNLKLINRRENALFNKKGYSKFDQTLQPTLRSVARLEASTFKREEQSSKCSGAE
ncbi:HNH endonuclease signature motif containing protein [Neisseria sp. Ec49-e6-T10]|uniref:HNH endonuclease signature motif containing protein n=1 Tax=Neisseria sp. Ec49-e6-T10 TaxID=3140744 RepID=UPI003EBF0D19